MTVIFISVGIRMVYPLIIDLDALYGPLILYMLPASAHVTFASTITLDPYILDSSWNLNQATQES